MSFQRALVVLSVVFAWFPLGTQEMVRSAPEIEALEPSAIVCEGVVLDPDGAPAEGALVMSSAGGKSVTNSLGRYRLELAVPSGTRNIRISSVGRVDAKLVASIEVSLSASGENVPVAPLLLARENTCMPSWLPTFGPAPGVTGAIAVTAVFDDGSGPALYVGGSFTMAGIVQARNIAKWDGSSWSALGSGTGGVVTSLAVFDDGSGPALYAAGTFGSAGGGSANRIAKWDGTSWSALGLGVGVLDDRVECLAVFDDGSGPALYAGGVFSTAGGAPANNIAKWNGSSWAALDAGVNGAVFALAVFDDGGGPALYAGGTFTSAGGVPVNRLARWNGTTWTSAGSGVNGEVRALAVFDDGGGPALHVAGGFTTANGMPMSSIAKWDGASWTPLGSGIFGLVWGLAVFDDGSGPALYVGGPYTSAGGIPVNGLAKWTGDSWEALPVGASKDSNAFAVFDDGGGPALYVGGGGLFSVGGGSLLAKWDGSSWANVGAGIRLNVHSMTVFDDGSGTALHVGGNTGAFDSTIVNAVAKWNGSSWGALGSGISTFGIVRSLAALDVGSGSAVYAGGTFSSAGGVSASNIARWDGTSWSALGSGLSGPSDTVNALTGFDDGAGPALYAGGLFSTAGGVAANRIARWNGSSWNALGSGLNGAVQALAVFDDGGGPALYVGGAFGTAGGVAASRVARWNGSSWSALGSGLNNTVNALAVFDDGGGPALYAGGSFTLAGGVSASRIAKWNGSSWSALGSGLSGPSSTVNALTVFDDGAGPALYAGGSFATAGGTTVKSIAKWNGSTWATLGNGTEGSVLALTVFNDRTGAALYVGGSFLLASDSGDSFLAKWGCPDTTAPALSCPAPLAVNDHGSPGEIVTYSVAASDPEDPTPGLVCDPPSGSFFPRGTTLVTCTATDFAGNQSTCQFQVSVRPLFHEISPQPLAPLPSGSGG